MTKESKRKEKYIYKLSQSYHQTVGVVWCGGAEVNNIIVLPGHL